MQIKINSLLFDIVEDENELPLFIRVARLEDIIAKQSVQIKDLSNQIEKLEEIIENLSNEHFNLKSEVMCKLCGPY